MQFNAPILWFEGMPLHPHHFQASDRNILENEREQARNLPYNWGLAEEIDYMHSLLQGEKPEFKINHARLRLEDGTWLNIPENAIVKSTEITSQDLQNHKIVVYLGIQKIPHEQGGPIVNDNEGADSIFVSESIDFQGETLNAKSKPIRVKKWQTKIVFSQQQLKEMNKQYEWIVIGRILKVGSVRTFNSQFIPPITNVCASEYLMTEVSNIVSIMNEKFDEIEDRVISYRTNDVDIKYKHLDDILRLQIYSSYRKTLHEFLQHKAKTHPFQLYLELCHLAGALQAVSPGINVKIDSYNHENLTKVMLGLIKAIMELLKREITPDYHPVLFIKDDKDEYLTCEIESKNIDFRAPIYICIISDYSQTNVDEDFLTTDVKIAPTEEIVQVLKYGRPGIEFTRVAPAPEGFDPDQRNHYFTPEQPLKAQPDYLKILTKEFSLSIAKLNPEKYKQIKLYSKNTKTIGRK